MAGFELRRDPKTKDVTGFRIVWRQDGARMAENFRVQWQALKFKENVEANGNRWPDGWIKGFGYKDEAIPESERVAAGLPALKAAKATAPTLLSVALEHFGDKSRLTKAGPEHRMKTRRDFTRHLPADGIGGMPIDEVTHAHIQDWLDDQVGDGGYAFKTIKTRRAALGAVFRVWCREHNTANPVEGTRNDGRESEFEPVFLKDWEIDAILEQLPTEQDRMYVELLVGTGMRKGEALALRVADLDLRDEEDGSTITIDKARKHGHDGNHRIGTTKTRSSRRIVTIDDGLADMLRAFTAGRAPGELLFDLGNEGTWQNNHWAPARNRAQLDKAPRIHDLRHTHASMLLAEGADLFKVSKRLGHKDIQTTSNLYGHLDKSGDVAMVKAYSKARNRRTVPALRLVGSA